MRRPKANGSTACGNPARPSPPPTPPRGGRATEGFPAGVETESAGHSDEVVDRKPAAAPPLGPHSQPRMSAHTVLSAKESHRPSP